MRTRTYILLHLLYIALYTTSFVNYTQSPRTSYLDSHLVLRTLTVGTYYDIHKALREALRKSLRTEALHRVPAIFPIASTRASAKYTPYIATLFFFTYPSLYPPY